MPAWVRLGRRKFYPTPDTPTGPISASEFDKVIGNALALTDAAGSCFASDLIQAYPKAKVVLNVRSDLDAWHRSAITNLVGANERWGVWLMSWLGAELFWMWHVYERILWYALFQCTDGTLRSGVEGKGKRIHEEHCDMVRGLMSRLGREEDLLEWQVEDGWEPLCRFLGKEVPDGPFPRLNDREGFKGREDAILKRTTARAVRNGLLLSGFFGGLVVVAWRSMR